MRRIVMQLNIDMINSIVATHKLNYINMKLFFLIQQL